MRAHEIMEAQIYFGGFSFSPQRLDVKKYMMGECPYIALAFNAIYGYELCEIGNHLATRDNDGFFWDVRGKMNSQQVVDGLGSSATVKVVDVPHIMTLMSSGLFSDGPFVKSRFLKAKTLVRALTL